jgi:hypothetical protein
MGMDLNCDPKWRQNIAFEVSWPAVSRPSLLNILIRSFGAACQLERAVLHSFKKVWFYNC